MIDKFIIREYTDSFDFLYIKDVLWYIVDEVDIFINSIKKLIKRDGYIYIMNAVPDLEKFYGQNKFPNSFSIINYFSKYFDIEYASSTYEIDQNRVSGNYEKDKYVRILLKERNN